MYHNPDYNPNWHPDNFGAFVGKESVGWDPIVWIRSHMWPRRRNGKPVGRRVSYEIDYVVSLLVSFDSYLGYMSVESWNSISYLPGPKVLIGSVLHRTCERPTFRRCWLQQTKPVPECEKLLRQLQYYVSIPKDSLITRLRMVYAGKTLGYLD